MEELARQVPGFLSIKSYHAEDGEVVTLSEWADEASAKAWGRDPDHARVQARGKAEYYESYTLMSCADLKIKHFTRGED
jgi:heme-degrading monooxygenase HmoA